MKFGKRLQAEAERRWLAHYVNYKGLKHAIYADVAAKDAQGTVFEQNLRQELEKVAAFYAARESELEAAMAQAGSAVEKVAALRSELQDLRKYVVLNYIAVVKAVKKRNRHLLAACGPSATSIKAVNILAGQHFFTSLKLAGLATRAEIAAREQPHSISAQKERNEDVVADFTCPICLGLLRNPVVLSCAHRFCWGCLVAHCSTVRNSQHAQHTAADKSLKQAPESEDEASSAAASPTAVVNRPAVWESDASDDDDASVATFGCPCCRKDQLLDLDRLQVDPHLNAFMERLDAMEKKKSSGSTTTTAAAAAVEVPQPETLHLKLQRQSSSTAPIAIASSKNASAALPIDDPMSLSSSSGYSTRAPMLAAVESMAVEPIKPMVAAVPVPPKPPVAPPRYLLPPQRPEHKGKLTVCLDIDGTLISSFTPKRAPSLPSSMVSYIVGKGGRLNPSGVFVVERPGLGEFLQRLNTFAEVVIFTAGLEDYAAPICDEMEARYGAVVHRLYRPATVHSDAYPCVKDLSRLGRDLNRCVLLDDTPLAFFFQPNHGIPILPFKGDIDDRILTEAVLPLLEALANEKDVSVPLARRFNMKKWFLSQGLKPHMAVPSLKEAAIENPQPAAAAPLPRPKPIFTKTPSAPALHNAPAAQILHSPPVPEVLLVSDFDKTLVDWDTAERLCDELAPELTSLLSQVETPANFIPITNTVLGEMQRRGISRDKIVATLRNMATEFPAGSARLLQWASKRGVDIRILSDANSLFISHVLTAAKLHGHVCDVITNPSTFQRLPEASQSAGSDQENVDKETRGWFFNRRPSGPSAISKLSSNPQYRLVVEPRHDHSTHGHHGCPLCPSNLCKGRELDGLCAAGPRRRVVYIGDGANDLCPALSLGSDDVVLARAGHPLEALIKGMNGVNSCENGRMVIAQVHVWHNHDELARLVEELAV